MFHTFKNPWESQKNENRNNSNFSDSFGNFHMPFKMQHFNDKSFYLITIFIVIALIALYGFTGVYIVNPDETAVEFVLGKYSTLKYPGLHFNFPTPIGITKKVITSKINSESIGYENMLDSSNGMLTKDESVMNVQVVVQWKISDPLEYVTSNVNARKLIHDLALTAFRSEVSKSYMRDLISGSNAAEVSYNVQRSLSEQLNKYSIGATVIAIQIKDIAPPKEVRPAFEEVQNAKLERESRMSKAAAYVQRVMSQSQSQAVKLKNEALAYRQERISKEYAEIHRISSLYEQYKANPDLIKYDMKKAKAEFYANNNGYLLNKSQNAPIMIISDKEKK